MPPVPGFIRNRSIFTKVMAPTLIVLAVTACLLVVYLRETSRRHTLQQADDSPDFRDRLRIPSNITEPPDVDTKVPG